MLYQIGTRTPQNSTKLRTAGVLRQFYQNPNKPTCPELVISGVSCQEKNKTFLDGSNLDSIFENEVFHDQTVSRLTFCGVKNMVDSFKYKGKFNYSCKQCWVCAIYVLAFSLQAFDDVKYIKKIFAWIMCYFF